MASFSVGPLPAEIVAPIYEAILASKYQGVEDPWHRVNDQIQFSAMISACGVEHAPDHNATSRGQSPCPSFQPATEISESEPINFAHFEWAQDSEVLRYQDNGEVNLVLDNDITKDLSPELCLAEKVGNADNVSASVTQALKRKRSANTLEETMVSKKSKETSKHSSPTEQSRMFDHDSIIMRSQCNLMSDKD